MARPKKDQPGGKEATLRWRETMLKKYGGKDGVKKKMMEIGRIGGLNGKGPDYKGGFASENSKARIAGAKGGKISRKGYKFIEMIDNIGIYEDKDGKIVEWTIKD